MIACVRLYRILGVLVFLAAASHSAWGAATIPADAFEPDDTALLAKPITPGVTQIHSLDNAVPHNAPPPSDIDFVKFTLTQTSDILIQTDDLIGVSPDTILKLYDSSGTNVLATNDDIDESSLDFLSRITYRAAAGTYYASVQQFSFPSGTPVTAYNLTLVVAPAGNALPPAIISRPTASAVAGSFFSKKLDMLQAPTIAVSTFSVDPTTPLPSGLTLDPNTGTLSGVPAISAISTTPVKVNITATNAGGSNTFTLSLTVSAFGIITTIAGDGTLQSGGDGGQAVLSKVVGPNSVALDAANNVLFTENGIIGSKSVTGTRLRRIDAVSGVVTTVTGGGSPNPLGDGGPITSANLVGPLRIAADANGNVYFSDVQFNSQHRVRKIAVGTGIVTTVAGSGSKGFGGDGQAATSATLNNPVGIATDAAGNIYIADLGNNRIRKITASTGIISTIAGTGVVTGTYATTSGDGGPAISATLSSPQDVAVDTNGNVYIADTGNQVIRMINTSGNISRYAGTGQTTGSTGDTGLANVATMSSPRGVAVDPATNDLYISDAGNKVVRVVRQSNSKIFLFAGTYTTGLPAADNVPATGGATVSSTPVGLVVSGGALYISDLTNERVRKVVLATNIISTLAGVSSTFNGTPIDGTPASAANFLGPSGVAADPTGNFYVVDQFIIAIYKIDTAKNIFTLAGNGLPGDGGLASLADLTNPSAVTVDAAGNIFIADTESYSTDVNHPTTHDRVRRIDAKTGIITTVAGTGTEGYTGDGGPARSADIFEPQGLAIDTKSNLYISDTGNNVIRVVNLTTGIITRLAGSATGVPGNTGDSGLATGALLSAPQQIALDTKGNLIVADTGNDRVRSINLTSGFITAFAGNGTAGNSGDGAAATLAQLNAPQGVSVDAQNNVYISDTGNSVVRRVDGTTGNITTYVGSGVALFSGDGGTALAAGIGSPTSAVVDSKGFIYIAEQSDNRIRKAGAASPPKITNLPLPLTTNVAAGGAVNYQVTASGFPAPTISANGIQTAGLSILPFGLLTGTPTSIGAFDITLIASNGIGTPDSQNLRILVAGTATPITFNVDSNGAAFAPPSVTPNPILLSVDKTTGLNLARVTGLAPTVIADAKDHVAYSWNFGDPAANPAAAPTLNPSPTVGETADHVYQGVSASATTPGVYPVTVTISDGIGPDIISDTTYVCVNKSDVTQNILISKAQFKFSFSSSTAKKGATGKDSITLSGTVPIRGGTATSADLYLGTLHSTLKTSSKTASIKLSKSSGKSTVKTALTPVKFSISLKGTLSATDATGVGKLGFKPKVTTPILINVPVVLSINGDSFAQQIQIIYKSTDKGGTGVQQVSGGSIGTR